MRNILLALVLIGVMVPVSAVAESGHDERDGTKECVENFTQKGSFFKGKTYNTWQEHKGASYDVAFRKVAQEVVAENWGDVETDKELGIISAGQAVTMGEGSVAPLSVVVKEKADGVIRVEATFGTAGFQKAATKTVREGLCKLVESPAADS